MWSFYLSSCMLLQIMKKGMRIVMLSNPHCSLVPQVDRLIQPMSIEITDRQNITNQNFCLGVILRFIVFLI